MNNFEDAKVGDLIVDYVSSNKYTRFLLILRICDCLHEYHDDYYDLNCIVLYHKKRAVITHFHFRNDDKNVILLRK